MATKRKIDRYTAHHEAGHAVAAFALRRRVVEIELHPENPNSFGHVRVPVLSGQIDDSRRNVIEREIMICLAGPIAEVACKGHRRDLGSFGDMMQALNIASYVSGSDAEAGAFVQWLQARTENLLAMDGNRAAVESIAEALLASRRLSGPVARRLYLAAQ